MSDKRPWTPGPWHEPLDEELNKVMVELLIAMVDCVSPPPSLDHPIVELIEDARKLLKEIGYAPEEEVI